MSEHIELDLPLSHRHASTVRAVAAALGADAGFSVDAIDDLRLGVNEAISVLSETEADDPPAGARMTVRFDLRPGAVVATVRRHGVDEPVAALDELARRILSAVVDEYVIDADGAFTVIKRVAADVEH